MMPIRSGSASSASPGGAEFPDLRGIAKREAKPEIGVTSPGVLIVNADDWGRDEETTQRTLECLRRGSVSSVSAMVFMEDSEHAAEVAREFGVDVGLHLNLTTAFSGTTPLARIAEHLGRISRFLLRNRLAQILYHPGMAASFEYVVAAQIDEFRRIYGMDPNRIDGHHHMHLSANVLLGKLLPESTIVRRSFSFRRGEKSWGNRLYRSAVDSMLSRRHRLTDFFFSLAPLKPEARLERIYSTACRAVVELETHPVNRDEYLFLMGDGIIRWTKNLPIAKCYALDGPCFVARQRRGNT
jgi:YdjC-like protein